ncbi:MAG: tyrosine-type recombinase/integrase [Clostridium sp.]|nr:tyrosine-type recombinase/integrase [Clostridium sp.]MCM1444172.1 tyrosine-type recombinase/integrase [Candidatus Amulumruptor caecigallinarius]
MIKWEEYDKTNYDYIYKHKTKGTYAVNFKLRDILYNKDVRKSKCNLKTIKDAQNWIAKEKVKFKEQGNQPKKTELFKDVFNTYIKECELKVRKGTLAESTVDGKKTIFKNQILPKLGNVKIAEISEEHINKFHDDLMKMNCQREKEKKLAKQTLMKVHKQLSAFLNYCVKKRLITYNPAGVVGNFKKEKEKKKVAYLEEEEFINLLSVVDNIRDLFMLQLLFYTGLRISEALGLSTDSIITTDEGTSLNITETYYKGKIRPYAKTEESEDDLFLDDITVDAYHTFLEYRKEKNITSKYLFANNRGKCEVIGDKAIRDMIKKYLKRAGIEKNITPHKLRHSHAALLVNMGMQLEDIKTRLRHKDIRTTSNEYGHMYKERKILLANDITNLRNKHNETTKTGTPNGTPIDKMT